MNKMCISFVSLAVLLAISAAGAVLAQEVATEETITISDLETGEPKVLPTSPFYFFKEMSRGLRVLITFNPAAKAELELKFANEKAAEVKKITETQPQNAEAIQKALENYQKTQTKLRARFEALKETSQNPNVDNLLNKLTDRVVKHEKLFEEISFKFKEKENIAKAVRKTMEGSENVIGEASKKDDAAKFSSRLERVLLEEKGGDLKHARSMEIIDRFSGKAPTEIKEALGRLREEFSERLESDIDNLVEKKGEEALKEKITGTPGDFAKRSVIIEEIQKRTGERLSQTIGKAMSRLEEIIDKDADIAQKAKEQIDRAEKMIQEAEKKIQTASTLLRQAKERLNNAKSAFEEKKYGEAFGQARSAEVLARNALRSFEKEKPETGGIKQHLSELTEKIRLYENLLKKQFSAREQNENAYKLLDNAVLHLGYAKEALAKEDLNATKLHISHVRGFLSKLADILERKVPALKNEVSGKSGR